MQTLLAAAVDVTNVNPRKEKHGDEDVLAMDLSLVAVVDEDKLDFLFGIMPDDEDEPEDLAGSTRQPPMPGLWDGNGNPRDKAATFVPSCVFEDVTVELHEKLTDKKSNEHIATFEDCKLKGFRLSPNHGRTVVLSFKVQANEDVEGRHVGVMAERIKGACYATISVDDLFDKVAKMNAGDGEDGEE